MKSPARYSGMFSDMPKKAWLVLTLSLILFVVHALVSRHIKAHLDQASTLMMSIYAISIIAAFILALYFGYLAWKTTENRRKQIEESQAKLDGLKHVEDYRNL